MPSPHTTHGLSRWYDGEEARRAGRGGGCQHIESGETGERRMPPRLPNPHRSISPTVQGMGENLKRELAQGFILPGTAFPRVSP